MTHAAIEALKEKYLAWTGDALADMGRLVQDLPAHPTPDDPKIGQIFETAHNIKGMGGSFGFPAMTEFGQLMCVYLRHCEQCGQPVDRGVLEHQWQCMHRMIEDGCAGKDSAWAQGALDQQRRTLADLGVESSPRS